MNWNFRQGGDTESPQNAAIKEFSKHIFESIVREAIQNSLDNPFGSQGSNPVTVKFEFGEIAKNEIPSYDDLLNHYNATKQFWQNDQSYKPIFDAIDNRLNDFSDNIPYLQISDFNTTGMNLTHRQNESIRLTSYYAFTRGNNTVKSNAQAGGSEGQGKATFYAASALRTLFIHTVSENGSIYEGLTRLATHTINNQDYSSNGHLFQDIDTPTYETQAQQDLPFRRTSNDSDYGSTISILGLWSYEDVEQKMIKSAINNFWMAISEGDLIVQVGDTELNQSNIESLIEQYIPERNESSHTKSNPTKYGRAKCYYETWTAKQQETETYSETIDTLGQCTLKISQHAEYPGKIAFFRKQKMLIVRSGVNSYLNKGYCGVFICTDDKGNQILRKMEGKTHTEWDPNLCMTEEDTKVGEKAMEEINKFINKSWQDYRSKHFPDTIELKGLAGLTISNTKSGIKKPTDTKKKPIPEPKPPRPKPEFEKLGIWKKGLSSVKENGIWKYSLILKTNDDKQLNIKMFPATDAARVSNDDLLEVINVSDGWSISKNAIEGGLSKGENTIEFFLNTSERVALDFKLNSL